MDSANPRYEIVLLRHGESIGNAQGAYQGQADFPLNETGRQQARALADHWRETGVRFDRIVSSPLSRAHETAEIIAEALNLPVDVDPLWMERDNGRMAGLTFEEIEAELPRPAFIHPYLPSGETGESQWSLYLRAGQALETLIQGEPGHTLVASHGGILNMVLYAALGMTPQADGHGPRFRFRNAAYATLHYYPIGHQWHLLGVNEQSHWRPESALEGSERRT